MKYENEKGKKRLTIDVDEDDPCLKKHPEVPEDRGFKFSPISGDPRYI